MTDVAPPGAVIPAFTNDPVILNGFSKIHTVANPTPRLMEVGEVITCVNPSLPSAVFRLSDGTVARLALFTDLIGLDVGSGDADLSSQFLMWRAV